jgi:NAD(P)-dependent dehydrogenase (short-subunit alcohol dehydrogenase family)
MQGSNDKKVLITGAQGALGTHVLQKALAAGFSVTGTFFPEMNPGINLPASDKLNWLQVDLTDSGSVREALKNQAFDGLVHCAGGFRYATIEKTTDEDLDFLIDTNLRCAFFLVRELISGMKTRNFGRIVFVSARSTLASGAGVGAYTASKAGLNMLTASLTEETKSFNITANAVLPTVIDTPANRKDMPQAPFADWVPPAELAEIIVSLLSPWGNSVRGALIPVSGRL